MLNQVIILSKKINQVSEGAENLYYRILVSVDDFGRYHADPKILRGKLYTLRNIGHVTIQKRLDELVDIGLINLYQDDGETYLEIVDFEEHQNFRSDIKRREEYPTPVTYLNESDTSRNEAEREEIGPSNSTNRNINRNKSRNKEEEQKVVYIVGYLNERAGRNFSTTSRDTAGMIRGRLEDGYSLEDFKHVIDIKVAKWKGDPKMQDYLRPSTLFRPTNFENYLNESMPTDKPNPIKERLQREREKLNA